MLLNPSRMPLLFTLRLLIFVSKLWAMLNRIYVRVLNLNCMFLVILLLGYIWWFLVQNEGLYMTASVTYILKRGFLIFIVSELILFFRLFWRFFNSYMSPDLDSRGLPFFDDSILPIIDRLSIPLLNTVILLSSGVSVTLAHHSITTQDYNNTINRIVVTYLLRILFLALQGFEYFEACFTISSGMWRSAFFTITGFHRAHVCIRTVFILINTARLVYLYMTQVKHVGFLAIAWYWHFVDLVWVFVYFLLYVIPMI